MGYVTVQEGYKRTLIIPVETFLSASQTADINECVSYFIESLLVSAAPYDSAGKTQVVAEVVYESPTQVERGITRPGQVPQDSGRHGGANSKPINYPSSYCLSTAEGMLSGTSSFSKLEEDVTGRDCGCQSGLYKGPKCRVYI